MLSGNEPTGAEIANAIARLEADPNLAAERAVHTLKWVDSDAPRTIDTSWLKWFGELFGWIAQSARVLIWIAAAILAGLLVIYVYRLLRARGWGADAGKVAAPSFVQDLDIRPESLPADIGAAALTLWERGAHRAALALLYRGLLSRLAHVHAVPIRDSSTEGDCLALAETHLPLERKAYAAELIRVWQRAVYGGKDPDSAAVTHLCSEFSGALDPAWVAGGQPA